MTDANSSGLARRLLFAIAAPVVLLIAVGAILGLQITRMSESATWVDHTDSVLLRIQELQRIMSSREAALRGFQLNADPAFADDFQRTSPHPIAAVLRTMVADNPQQVARLDEVLRRYSAWEIEAQKVFSGSRQVDSGAITSRKKLADAAHVVLDQMRSMEEGLRAQRSAELERATEVTKWAFIVLLLMTALTLAFLSRRSLMDVTRTFHAALTGEREVRQRVELEEWLRGGVLATQEATRGDLSLEELSTRALAALASYLRADVGALFVRVPQGFHREAGFGLDTRDAGPDYFADGEGLIGRAARATEAIAVSDVPEDFLKIRSGIGEAKPRHLLLSPARHEGWVLAVLELGFLREPSSRHRQLLERVGDTIASAINSA
ncbi:MAG TPA: GAF domain-containing protein, partial [Polyangiales bacterium]|nr:GAF domain-containing protein [Polyangiales bacterium]